MKMGVYIEMDSLFHNILHFFPTLSSRHYAFSLSCTMADSQRNDEERIIESIVLEGERRLFEVFDFLPIRQSLYNTDHTIPEYDDEVGLLIQ